MKEDFCRILRVSTSSSFLYLFSLFINQYAFGFYFCFRSLLIDTRLVLRYSSQSPLEEVIGDLEYQCSFIRLYMFLFAFLIICIEAFGFS